EPHLKIFLVAAIVGHFAQIFFEGLQINHSIVAFGIIVTAEPCSDKPRLIDFVMHELVTVDFRNVDRQLSLGRLGRCNGKDGYDAHAFPWHKDPPLKKSQFSQSDPLVVPILSTAWNSIHWVQRGQDGAAHSESGKRCATHAVAFSAGGDDGRKSPELLS